jgi:hypothetical protein
MVRMLVSVFDKTGAVISNQWIDTVAEAMTFVEYWIDEYGEDPDNLLNYDFTITFYPDA